MLGLATKTKLQFLIVSFYRFATTATSLATSPGSALRSATREAEVAAVEVVDTGAQEAADPTG